MKSRAILEICKLKIANQKFENDRVIAKCQLELKKVVAESLRIADEDINYETPNAPTTLDKNKAGRN